MEGRQKFGKNLNQYVKEGLKREEIMDFLLRDFPEYAWSLRTLDRRLQYFDISYTDRNVTIDQLQTAVKKEIERPGQFLGYLALHKKIRQVHDHKVPRDLVYTQRCMTLSRRSRAESTPM